MKHIALIVAGGAGTRMQNVVPKQFLLLGGKPVLMHTLEKFAACEVVLVLPEPHIVYWQLLCEKHGFTQPHTVVAGGSSRSESVCRGLQHVSDDAVVAIHDGVRPLVSRSMIEAGFRMAEEKGNALPVIALTDSIRELTADGSKAVDRTRYCLVQTPQVFRAAEIKEAYRHFADEVFTDDASVLEAYGISLNLYDGETTNIKITRPADLALAEALLDEK